MLKPEGVKLSIQCPACKRSSEEYSWTMKTAAMFSIGEDTCPGVLQVMLATLDGEGEYFDGYRMVCPRCHNGVNFDEIQLPAEEEIRAYAEAAGEEYRNLWL
ncbi:MAG TPA: hypothetical protein GX404_03790 [Syntrophomonadaceae bacterium]|nr:hypothetical protein [Syntrophomonadaceae bacterium]